MPPRILSNKRLNRIAKGTINQVEYWKEGASLENDSGRTISQLIFQAAAERWRLAYDHRRNANKFVNSKPPMYRSAISRYYYSMYHAMRACVFVFNGGDDYQEHSKLQSKIPRDFPSGLNWENILKDARELRNRADYDPFPKSDAAWKKYALSLKVDTDLLLANTRTYLQNKGCVL